MRVVVNRVFAGYVPVNGDNPNNLTCNNMKIVRNGQVGIIVHRRNRRFPKVGRDGDQSLANRGTAEWA